ncbi:MAG: hypothetical protein ABT940_07285 [Alphaproteobacteria bacterium]
MVLHTTAQEHFAKLTRVNDRLAKEVHKDDLDDFFKTAYHLIEITEKDPSVSAAQKAQATALRNDPDIKLCQEITNQQKHYTVKKNAQIKDASVSQGWGVGRFDAGGWGVGEQSVTLNLADGTSRDARSLVSAIYAIVQAIFL